MKTTKTVQKEKKPFVQQLKKIGITVASISAALLAAPVALPGLVIKAARYLSVAGSIASSLPEEKASGVKTRKKKA